jgi:hypothetical protein
MAKRKKNNRTMSSPGLPGKEGGGDQTPQKTMSRVEMGILAGFAMYGVCLLLATVINIGTLSFLPVEGYSVLRILQMIGACAFGIVFAGMFYVLLYAEEAERE